MPQSAAIFEKTEFFIKRAFSPYTIKLRTPIWPRKYVIHLEKSYFFHSKQIRIIEFCPFDSYHALNHRSLTYSSQTTLRYMAFPSNYAQGKAVKGRAPDKSVYWKIIFFISHPKHMLWILKRAVSMRLFF